MSNYIEALCCDGQCYPVEYSTYGSEWMQHPLVLMDLLCAT